nr:glycoside hydrolase family 16 protein [Peribacillus deserti]
MLAAIITLQKWDKGGGESIKFSGYDWYVKDSGNAKWGPGPNVWSKDNVWIDQQGRLHLRITKRHGVWTCPELYSAETLGYGTYRFYIDGRIDNLDPNAVLGLFTHDSLSEDANDVHYREIDIEYAKWGNAGNRNNAHYTVQPYNKEGNLHSFHSPAVTQSMHSFTWKADEITFNSSTGHVTGKGTTIQEWRYRGDDIPDSKNERVDINLWLFKGKAPASNNVEVIIRKFEFIPWTGSNS